MRGASFRGSEVVNQRLPPREAPFIAFSLTPFWTVSVRATPNSEVRLKPDPRPLVGHEPRQIWLCDARVAVTSGWYAPSGMTPDAASSPHSLATASGLLLGAFAASAAVGTFLGWLAGSWSIGLLVGALAGIPLGIFSVYVVYSKEGSA
jgi:hypothetical protein